LIILETLAKLAKINIDRDLNGKISSLITILNKRLEKNKIKNESHLEEHREILSQLAKKYVEKGTPHTFKIPYPKELIESSRFITKDYMTINTSKIDIEGVKNINIGVFFGLFEAYDKINAALDLLLLSDKHSKEVLYKLLLEASMAIEENYFWEERVDTPIKRKEASKTRWSHQKKVKNHAVDLYEKSIWKSPRDASKKLAPAVLEFAEKNDPSRKEALFSNALSDPNNIDAVFQATDTIYKWFLAKEKEDK